MKVVSIITPAYNNPSQLEKFLRSVEISSLPGTGFEVIVVDDGSEADIGSVAGRFQNVRFVRLDRHAGPSVARNAGAKEAKGDILLFFDSDVTLKPDTLSAFMVHFKNGEMAVTGEYDIEPIENGFFPKFKALLAESWIPRDQHVSIFLLRAAGIRKDLFVKLGGFDESIKKASVEDYEFGDKLAMAGVKISYDPKILVRHHHPTFRKQMRVFYLRAADWADIFIKRRGRFDTMCATPSEGIGSVAGAVFLLSALVAITAQNRLFGMLGLGALIVYMISNINFITIINKRSGFLFIPIALAVKLPLTCAITAGFAAGMFRIAWRRVSSRKMTKLV